MRTERAFEICGSICRVLDRFDDTRRFADGTVELIRRRLSCTICT